MTRPAPGAVPCPVCAGPDTRLRFHVRSPYLPERTDYGIRSCPQCGHFHATGPLSAELLSKVYGESFHGTSQQAASDLNSPVRANARRRAEWLRESTAGGRLLDVGAGRGYFVYEAARYFDASGIDYSSSAAAYGRELGVVLEQGDFLRAPYRPGEFDVLTFWDVLASMPDLHATIARAATLLRAGGHAVFTVPLADSYARRVAGRRWPLWIPPVNLHYFSRDSIERLLRQHGLRVESARTTGKRVALNFLLYKLAASFNASKLARRAAALPLNLSIPLNLGDILTVVARKDE